MIKQFLECTSRSRNAVPLFRPENAGRSTRKRSTRQCSTRGHITRPENQKLSLSSGCHNFVISSPILIIFSLNIIYVPKGIFLSGFWLRITLIYAREWIKQLQYTLSTRCYGCHNFDISSPISKIPWRPVHFLAIYYSRSYMHWGIVMQHVLSLHYMNELLFCVTSQSAINWFTNGFVVKKDQLWTNVPAIC